MKEVMKFWISFGDNLGLDKISVMIFKLVFLLLKMRFRLPLKMIFSQIKDYSGWIVMEQAKIDYESYGENFLEKETQHQIISNI